VPFTIALRTVLERPVLVIENYDSKQRVVLVLFTVEVTDISKKFAISIGGRATVVGAVRLKKYKIPRRASHTKLTIVNNIEPVA
jgi:hypothetical protein